MRKFRRNMRKRQLLRSISLSGPPFQKDTPWTDNFYLIDVGVCPLRFRKLGTCKGGWQKGLTPICPERRSEGGNRNKSEQSRPSPEEIGTDRKKQANLKEAEHIRLTTFL